jgi:Tol biopolymer transport system component
MRGREERMERRHRRTAKKPTEAAKALGLVSGAVALGLFLEVGQGAAQTSPTLQAQEVFSSTTLEVSGATLSPDKRWIAFSGRPSPDRTSLYVVPADGGEAVQLTEGAFRDTHPAWAPDSRSLFFFSDRTGGPESGVNHLMRMPFDTETGRTAGVPRPLSLEGFRPWPDPPAVSPDGRWVALVALVEGPDPNYEVRLVPAQGGAEREIGRFLTVGELAFSEDNQSVLLVEYNPSSRGVYEVPLEGGAPRFLFPYDDGQWLWAISGDGRRFLWGRKVSAALPDSTARVVTDRNEEVLASFVGGSGRWEFSYDGSSIVWETRKAENSVVSVPLKGGEETTLLTDSEFFDLFGWTRGGQLLAYGGNANQAFMIDPIQGTRRDISLPLEPVLEHGWLVAVHPDGRHVMGEMRSDPDAPPGGELSRVIVDVQTGAIQTVSTFMASASGAIYGNPGNQLDRWPASVLGDRFLFFEVRGDDLCLMAVRPGEEPELVWTYPKELVTEPSGRARRALMGAPIGLHGELVAWVRSNGVLNQLEVHPDTRSTLMITNTTTGHTREVATLQGILAGPTWSRDGRKIAMEYRPEGREPRHLAVVRLDEQEELLGEPLVLDAGTIVYVLGGWTPDDRSLFFEGEGVEGRNRWSFFALEATPGSIPIDLTPNDRDPGGSALLSPDGSFLVYDVFRTLGSTILRYDLPRDSGGYVPR